VVEDNQLKSREVPMRNALNEVLRGEYVKDCEKGLARWNKVLAEEGLNDRLYLPDPKFHRHVGEYAGHTLDIHGNLISREEFEKRKAEWLPSMEDREYVPDASSHGDRKDRKLDRAAGRGNQGQAVRF
jgi:benzoyl-CoA 2,3-dioxygenase component B